MRHGDNVFSRLEVVAFLTLNTHHTERHITSQYDTADDHGDSRLLEGKSIVL